MDTNYIINELQRNKFVFKELLQNLDSKIIVWKPNPQKWCLLEIVCHLQDEECEDFRERLKNTLENPKQTFVQLDPVEWVSSRNYIDRDFKVELTEFLDERENSINFLEGLKEPKWDNYYDHPKFGNMTAKLFFTNWLAHDYLHIKQILKIKFDYLSATTDEKLNYAGTW
jgi:DinB superfamily